MPSDPNEFFRNEQGSSGLDKPLDRVIDHADLIGSGYTPHEDIDKHIEQMHDWSTRCVVTDKTTVATLNAKSDVSWTELDLSSYITPNTYLIKMEARIRDSGSAANNNYIQLAKNGIELGVLTVKGGQVNDMWIYGNADVPCDSNGIIEYKIKASGVGTADVVIYLLGYFEYIYKPFKE